MRLPDQCVESIEIFTAAAAPADLLQTEVQVDFDDELLLVMRMNADCDFSDSERPEGEQEACDWLPEQQEACDWLPEQQEACDWLRRQQGDDVGDSDWLQEALRVPTTTVVAAAAAGGQCASCVRAVQRLLEEPGPRGRALGPVRVRSGHVTLCPQWLSHSPSRLHRRLQQVIGGLQQVIGGLQQATGGLQQVQGRCAGGGLRCCAHAAAAGSADWRAVWQLLPERSRALVATATADAMAAAARARAQELRRCRRCTRRLLTAVAEAFGSDRRLPPPLKLDSQGRRLQLLPPPPTHAAVDCFLRLAASANGCTAEPHDLPESALQHELQASAVLLLRSRLLRLRLCADEESHTWRLAILTCLSCLHHRLHLLPTPADGLRLQQEAVQHHLQQEAVQHHLQQEAVQHHLQQEAVQHHLQQEAKRQRRRAARSRTVPPGCVPSAAALAAAFGHCQQPSDWEEAQTPPAAADEEAQTPPAAADEEAQTPTDADEEAQTPPAAADEEAQTPPAADDEEAQTPADADEEAQTPAAAADEEAQTPPAADEEAQTPPAADEEAQTPAAAADEEAIVSEDATANFVSLADAEQLVAVAEAEEQQLAVWWRQRTESEAAEDCADGQGIPEQVVVEFEQRRQEIASMRLQLRQRLRQQWNEMAAVGARQA